MESEARGWNTQVVQVVCCSVLQYVAVCCSVLRCVAVCCSVLQRLAVYCERMKYTSRRSRGDSYF